MSAFVANSFNVMEETSAEIVRDSVIATSNLLPTSKCPAYMAIFEDALDQLAVLADITPDIHSKKGMGNGLNSGGEKPLVDSITKILKDQRALEDRYNQLVSDQSGLKALPNKSQFKKGQAAISDVSHEIQSSNQVLAKRLKSHPSVAQNLLKIQQERSTLQTLISKTIREVKECRYDSLILAVEEEYKKKNTLQNTINRENEASELLKDLQRELLNEKKLLEDESNDRIQVIQQLKDTVQEINALTSSEQKYVKKEIKAHESSVRQQCQTKELTLTETRALLQKKIDVETRVHEKIIEFLSRQREEMEKSIQEWMNKYEEDTEAKTNELEGLKQSRTTDLDKFEELMVAYEEIAKVVEEDKAQKLLEAEAARVKKLQENAAARITRWWMRILKRRADEKAAKAASKKSAKGKKKK